MKASKTKNKRPPEPVITIQNASGDKGIPLRMLLKGWCALTLLHQKCHEGEICIRIVDKKEMKKLNKNYRGKDSVTNVLSFPASETATGLLGDIVLCAAVINQEAAEQEKTRAAHWAHMVVHGTLHLLGFDHMKPKDARNMEALEVRILRQYGFNNPYN